MPPIDEMLTIDPPPCSSMIGITALQVRNAEVTLMSNVSYQSSTLTVGKARPGPTPPTLLCRMSMRP